MRIFYLLAIVLSLQLCAASSAQLSSSQTFTDVDASEINRCVFQFAENRGKFDRYVCNLEMKIESTTSKTSAAKIHDLFIAEDRSKKLRRVDKITSDLGVEVNGELLESGDSCEMTVISRGDESRYFRGYGEEIDSDSVFASEKPFLKSDPWSICITEIRSLESGRGGESDYWSRLFDDKQLLWCETSSDFARGEWDYGPAEARVQVYFDLKTSKMPVLIRFIRPSDKTVRFAKVGRTFVSENEIKWEKVGSGYVPTSIRVKRTNYSVDGKIKGSVVANTDLKWKSSLENTKGVDDRVFSVGSLKLDELIESFR